MLTNMCGYLNCAIFVCWVYLWPLCPLSCCLFPAGSWRSFSVRSKQNGNYAAFLLPNQGEIYLNRLDLASKTRAAVVGGGSGSGVKWFGNGLIGLLGLPREADSAAGRHINNWMAGGQHTHSDSDSDFDWYSYPGFSVALAAVIYSATQNDESMIPPWEIRSTQWKTHHQHCCSQSLPTQPTEPQMPTECCKQITGNVIEKATENRGDLGMKFWKLLLGLRVLLRLPNCTLSNTVLRFVSISCYSSINSSNFPQKQCWQKLLEIFFVFCFSFFMWPLPPFGMCGR